MTSKEAKEFLIGISYSLGNMSVEYLSEKDGEKMREAIEVLEQYAYNKGFENYRHEGAMNESNN